MTIGQLKNIFEKFDDDVLIEYMPRAHEYITEHVIGVRAESSARQIVLLGVTELC